MKAVVFRAVDAPLAVTEVHLEAPRSHEVLVKIAAAGVCHSDLHVVRGEWKRELPTVVRSRRVGQRERRRTCPRAGLEWSG
jgi:S-(hydroxymethyl)glutathione dehydrogenase/alcohol dehydrogenase